LARGSRARANSIRADVGNSGGNVGCDGRTEVGEALASVVKVGNRFMQARAGEIGELSLKVAKCEGGGSSFFKRPDDVVGGGPLDEVVAAPVAVIVVQMERVAGASGDQLQGFSTSRDGFVGYVSGHALDIFHQRGDVGEHVMIYPLEMNRSGWPLRWVEIAKVSLMRPLPCGAPSINSASRPSMTG